MSKSKCKLKEQVSLHGPTVENVTVPRPFKIKNDPTQILIP